MQATNPNRGGAASKVVPRKTKQRKPRTTVVVSPTAPSPLTDDQMQALKALHGKPRKRAVMRCKKCRAEGYRSDGCGRTHNVGAVAEPSGDGSEDESRAPRVRPSRAVTLAEELPVIPHATLVAMLFADRANNAVGDTGGTPLRADAGPSLIGHTDEKRELCPVHGWVGRVAFDREQHGLCALEGERCTRCNGTGWVTTGSLGCKHCNGSGVEPVEAAAPEIAPTSLPNASPGQREYVEQSNGVGGTRKRPRRGDAPRATTLARKALTRAALAEGRAELDELGPLVDEPRPKTRAECVDSERPCPWVTCKHHLYLDINPETGSIKINFPDLEPWELQHSCALDVASYGGLTLDQVGLVTNLTRERIRQVEVRAFHELKTRISDDEDKGEDAA